MSFLTPNQGEGIWAEAALNKTAPQDLKVKLYQNNYTCVDGSTEGNFTEATFTGYGAVTLTAANWTVTPGAPTLAQYPQITFTSTAGSQNQAIYGYFIVQVTSGKLVHAWRFDDGPYTIVNNGDQILVTPKINVKKVGE